MGFSLIISGRFHDAHVWLDAPSLLFIAAMTTFFLGPLWFLREISLATTSRRIGR
jgi:hypothetical protein